MKNKEKKIEDIKKEIKNLENDMEEIQSKCLHKEDPIIKFDLTQRSVIRICKDCEKDLGYATSQELKDNGYNK